MRMRFDVGNKTATNVRIGQRPRPLAGGCGYLQQGRSCVRLVDGSPTDNVAPSDGVAGSSEPAADTPKEGLVGTIPLIVLRRILIKGIQH